jgi:hypothetical protein
MVMHKFDYDEDSKKCLEELNKFYDLQIYESSVESIKSLLRVDY